VSARVIPIVVVALAGAAGLWFPASGAAAGPSAKHTVTIEATSYKPEAITVKKVNPSRGSTRTRFPTP
jgi:hypothetical protein